jgi:S-(hydroxymethyl)glutathione dehydrogenase / alcohol dehydrogenase
MKAAVCYELGKPMVVEDIILDHPKHGEVKVKMAVTAICHSDIHVINGDLPNKIPFVVGHESSGYVDEIGEGVTGLKKGDPVVLSLLSPCGKCQYCLTGRSWLCSGAFPMDKETRMHNKKGQDLTMVLKTASFAEYTVVDQSQLVKIPKDMSMESAALLACGVITGWGAVVNRAKVKIGESCVIIGVGGVGLNAIQGTAVSGAYPIIAVDIADKKLEAAKKFGATHVINSSKVDVVQEVKKLTGGGTNYAFITVGSVKVIEQAFNMIGPRGMAVIVGLPKFTDTLTLSPLLFIKDEKILTGGYMGSTQLQTEINRLIKLYKAGVLKLDELITNRFSLDNINEAIEQVKKGDVLRNIIVFK